MKFFDKTEGIKLILKFMNVSVCPRGIASRQGKLRLPVGAV